VHYVVGVECVCLEAVGSADSFPAEFLDEDLVAEAEDLGFESGLLAQVCAGEDEEVHVNKYGLDGVVGAAAPELTAFEDM
jgi:hypothetical protein